MECIYRSTVKPNTLAPVWNEYWKIRNVPIGAKLHIDVLDKDNGTVTDDFIGESETDIAPGARELTLQAAGFRSVARGTMWIKVRVINSPHGIVLISCRTQIDSIPAADPRAQTRQYIFDGPIRYSRHFAPTVGLLGNVQDSHLYSTWKMFLRGVPLFFGNTVQPWNKNYKAAQTIFNPGPTSMAVRSTIQAGHRMLYARSTTNNFGVVKNSQDIVDILHGGKAGTQTAHRVKPAVYTYIISVDDDSFRFSETGAAFFVDFASKHALHANCAEAVRYSGEFHPRPEGGWENFNDETPDDQVQWELVLDNNSGTYAPDPMMLAELKELFEYNFPEFQIWTFDFNDPRLAQSRDACRAYALAKRGVSQDELQPHAHVPGEETLSHRASVQMHPDGTPILPPEVTTAPS